MKKIIPKSWDIDEEYDENIYVEATREEWLENDEISTEEEAFMNGYDEAG